MTVASEKKYPWWLGIFIAVYFSIILIFDLSRHWGFMTSINDLGVFDQAVWGALHGKILLNTSQLNQPINWLGFHFQPVLYIFVPLYALIPSVIWFIIVQTFALAIGAWAIFFLASRVCHSEKTGLLWALVYLANPFLLTAAIWDFHPVSLAVPFVATGMIAVEIKNRRLLLFSALFILLCKEHLGLMVVGFGLLWWIRNKQWKTAAGLILLGAAHFCLVLGVIMPAFSPVDTHPMFKGELGHLSRYSWLGNSLKEIFQTLFFHPVRVIKTVLLKMEGAIYLLVLLILFLGFPLAAPEYLLPGLPDLMANMLSLNPFQRSIFAYHSVCLVPVFTVAGIYGTKRFSLYVKKFSLTELAGFVVVAIFISGYYFAPLPLPGAQNAWAPINLLNWPDPNLPAIRYAIGDHSSVSAQNNVGAHFSQRREIYCYPNNMGKVKMIILRLEIPTTSSEALHQHLGMELPEYLTSIERLLSGKEYGVLLWDDPWLVFERGLADHRPNKQIQQKLDQLRKEWQ